MAADGEDDHARAPPRAPPPKPKRDSIVLEGRAADVNATPKPSPRAEAPPRSPNAGRIGAGAVGGVIGAVLTIAGLWALDARPSASELARRIDVLESEAVETKASSRLASLESGAASAAAERKSLSDKYAALPPAAPPEAVAALADQVRALQAAGDAGVASEKLLADKLAALPPAAPPEAVAALAEQIRALQSAADASAAVQKSLSDDVAQLKSAAAAAPVASDLEKRVAGLEARAANPTPSAAPDTPGPDPRIGEIAAAQAALSDKLAKASAGADALSARLGKLEAAVFAAKAETRVAPSAASPAAAKPPSATVRAIAALALRARLAAGEPYASELAALQSAGVEASALDSLRPTAATGVPTLAALNRSLPEVGVKTAGPQGSGAAVERWLGEVQGLVQVRKAGESPATDSGPGMARVRAALADGDLVGAVAELNTWPDAARAPAAAWLKGAQARIAATNAADALVQTAIADLVAANR